MDRLKKLITALPKIAFHSNRDTCAPYDTDWTKTKGEASLVALPKTTAEVANLLRFCFQNDIPVVPSGGRTGLAGGATAICGELVLSLEKLNKIGEIDVGNLSVKVQAGVTNEALQEFCSPHELMWPIDLGSRGSCQIGGNLSTNAGGLHVIRYGMSRRWVTGLQIVKMDGTILELNHGLEKNNTGYDLLQLIIGSEGTLAVITEATLKLVPVSLHKQVAFFAIDSMERLEPLLLTARKAKFCLNAFEFFSARCLNSVASVLNFSSPLKKEGQFYVLVEIDTDQTPTTQVESWLEKIVEENVVLDGLLSRSSDEERSIWKLRESITESLQKKAPVRKYDISVPLKNSIAFLHEIEQVCADPKYPFDLFLFGHFGDGSPHLNLVRNDNVSVEDFLRSCHAFEAELYPILKKYDGSASAEHGVGLLKKSWVKFSRSPEELAIFQGIKNTFDPKNLLNPKKYLPD